MFIPPVNRALDDGLGDFVRRASSFLNVVYSISSTVRPSLDTTAVAPIFSTANNTINTTTLFVSQQSLVATTTVVPISDAEATTIGQQPQNEIVPISNPDVPRYVELTTMDNRSSIFPPNGVVITSTAAISASNDILINSIYDDNLANILPDATMIIEPVYQDSTLNNGLTCEQQQFISNVVPVGTVNYVNVCDENFAQPTVVYTTSITPFIGHECTVYKSEQQRDITTLTASTASTSRMSSCVQRAVRAQPSTSFGNATTKNNVCGIPTDELAAIVKRLKNAGTEIVLETVLQRNETVETAPKHIEMVDLTNDDDFYRLLNEALPDEMLNDAFAWNNDELAFANLNPSNSLDVSTTQPSQ